MHRIMLVDDEENILKSLIRIMGKNNEWEIETYVKPADALKRAMTANFDLFLSDFRMPEMDGVKFLTEVKNLQPESMRLILSGYTDLEALMGAINEAQIFRFITKPWQDYDLISTVKLALGFRDMQVENRRLADQVREQQAELEKQNHILETYRQKHPELFSVKRAADGSIILDEGDI